MIRPEDIFYIDNWARKAPFPGKDYAINTMDKLYEAYIKYRDVFKDMDYKLKLSSGETVNFKMYDMNIPSLLGLETQNLISEQLHQTVLDVLGINSYSERRGFEYLKKIIERADEVIKNDSLDYSYKILNYYRVKVKSSIFQELPCFDEFDYGIINNQESHRCINGYNSKYIFIRTNEELTPYFIMSLRYDKDKGIYVPTTLLAMRQLGTFIDKQELVLPLNLTTTYFNKTDMVDATPKEKIQLLNMYRDIIKQYHTDTKINLDGVNLVKRK